MKKRISRGIVLIGTMTFMLISFQRAQSQPEVVISGFVDAYYSYNFAQPESRMNTLRNFDIQENQFTLSLAELVIQKAVSTASPVGARIDLDYGTTNDIVQPANTSSLALVQQAYVTALLPVGNGLTVDVGKFVTHMGYEVIESKDNWNYSRSLLFAWAIPYYHTGMRLMYPVLGNLTAFLHVVNGWNSGTDNNSSKSFGATLNYAATPTTGIILNGMWGHENLTAIEDGARNVYDLIFTQSVTDNFAVGLNADYGEAGTSAGLATWRGAAVYGRYAIDTLSAVAVRAEYFDDPIGYATGSSNTYSEFTLTFEHKLFNRMLVRAEFRDDMAKNALFDKKDEVGTQKNQATILLGLVVPF